jgi:hypothetical protein
MVRALGAGVLSALLVVIAVKEVEVEDGHHATSDAAAR